MTSLFDKDIDFGDLNVGSLSDEDSDAENRDEEIKKLLEEGLEDETFDCGSEKSFGGGEESNNNSRIFSKLNGTHEDRNSVERNPIVNGHNLNDVLTLAFSQSRNDAVNGNGFTKDIFQHSNHSPGTGNGTRPNSFYTNNVHKNGVLGVNGYGGFAVENGSTGASVTGSPKTDESDREDEEIVAKNPTISMVHNGHCPQNESDLGTDIWLAAGSELERLKTLLAMRERQLMNADNQIETLCKEKRALQHQTGLMKVELMNMQNREAQYQKSLSLRSEEAAYYKNKMSETIDEYEQIRNRETTLKDENDRLGVEIEKLNQEIKLLSAIGASTHQKEVNDIIRGVREKHARELAGRDKVVNELEERVRLLERKQQYLNESDNSVPELGRRGNEDVGHNMVYEELGAGGGSTQMKVQNLASIDDILNANKLEWKTKWLIEKEKLCEMYETEINSYRNQLAKLPVQLYKVWEETQTQIDFKSSGGSKNVPSGNDTPRKNQQKMTSVEVQVHQTLEDKAVCTNDRVNDSVEVETQTPPNQLEPSEVTEAIFAALKDQQNLLEERAVNAESQLQFTESEMNKLRKKFKALEKLVSCCRKQWLEQEEALRKKNADLQAHYAKIFRSLSAKLETLG